jgi:hypothetical protein
MMPIFKARKLMLMATLVVACLIGGTAQAQQPASADQSKPKLTETELKAKILASAEWKQAFDEYQKWLAAQAIYTPADVERMKANLLAQVQSMPAAELQGFLDDWQARLKVLNGRDFQEAQQWLGEYLSVVTDGFRRRTLQNFGLTDVSKMSAAELEDALIRVRADQMARQQSRAAFDQSRQQAVQRVQQNNAARQGRSSSRAAQFGTTQSPYRPKFNPPPPPRRQFFVDQNGNILFGLPF